MKFCSSCGEKLNDEARFCFRCGKSDVVSEQAENTALDKCPYCGGALNSFSNRCPWCDCELQKAAPSNFLKEFAQHLSMIEAEQMEPDRSEKSMKEMIFGSDSKKAAARAQAEAAFEQQKATRKATYIINYPAPNSKEDLLEFMMLISSNISAGSPHAEVLKAWEKKSEQVYKKAKLLITNEADLLQIEQLHKKSKRPSAKNDMDCLFLLGRCISF